MENCQTPQKIIGYSAVSVKQFYKKSSPVTFKFINNHIKTQLSNSQKNYGKISCSSLITQTPDKTNKFLATSGSNIKSGLNSTTKSLNIFPLVNTPPSGNIKCRKVVNPFEAALSERLHLPLICSPLFHRPSTPQHSSTNFEWTIEEVSSIGPANVEAHETQFQDSLDPEIEAKTQAAISSFFKEQQIVPSPVDCPLRKQRIVLEKTESTPNSLSGIIRPAKRIRDGITQTILSLPPVLPDEIEKALKPYFNFFEVQQQSPTINCDKSSSLIAYHEARDASLRRKLFALPNKHNDDTFEGDLDENELFENSAFSSPPPKSPDLVEEIANKSAFDKNSFGSLSPISKLSSDSPHPKRFSSERHFMNDTESENISPIKSASPNMTIQESKINSTSLHQQKLLQHINKSFADSFTDSNLYRSTPDNSINLKSTSNESQSENNNMSVDSSFNCKISRLLVNSYKGQNNYKTNSISKSKSMTEVDIFNQNDYDDDDMQVSQLSEKSTISSHSSNADTPRRSKKTPSRKNLSRSFSSNISDDEDDIYTDKFSKDIRQIINDVQKRRNSLQNVENVTNEMTDKNKALKSSEKSVFYRVDSGFNEMTNNQDDTKFVQIAKKSILADKENHNFKAVTNENITLENEDISMISCSTPSRRVC